MNTATETSRDRPSPDPMACSSKPGKGSGLNGSSVHPADEALRSTISLKLCCCLSSLPGESQGDPPGQTPCQAWGAWPVLGPHSTGLPTHRGWCGVTHAAGKMALCMEAALGHDVHGQAW